MSTLTLIEILKDAGFDQSKTEAIVKVITENEKYKSFVTKQDLDLSQANQLIKIIGFMAAINGILFALLKLTS